MFADKKKRAKKAEKRKSVNKGSTKSSKKELKQKSSHKAAKEKSSQKDSSAKSKSSKTRSKNVEPRKRAIAIVGRHNSGKTTVIESVIRLLVDQGYDVASVKHQHHKSFEIDYPGKDSYRLREAGASEVVITSEERLARIQKLDHELECDEVVASMPGHDIIIVEGYRHSGLPTIEIMRQDNFADASIAEALLEGQPFDDNLMSHNAVAVITDMPTARHIAMLYQVPVFDLSDIKGVAAFIVDYLGVDD